MGRKRKADGGDLFPRYRPEKVSIGVELKKLPPALPELHGDALALQLYEYTGGELIRSGKMATTDVFSLQVYCMELADYLRLRKQIGGVSKEIEGGTRTQISRLMEKKLDTVFKWAKELGLTPHTRGLCGKVTQIEPGAAAKIAAIEEINLD